MMIDLGSHPEMVERTHSTNGAAMRVHRILGPGFPEEVYRESLAIEFRSRGHHADEALKLPAFYAGVRLRRTYEVDIMVDRCLVIELKATPRIVAPDIAQTLSYLRMTNLPVGVIYNFGVDRFQDGCWKRILNPTYDSGRPSYPSVSSVYPSLGGGTEDRPVQPDIAALKFAPG